MKGEIIILMVLSLAIFGIIFGMTFIMKKNTCKPVCKGNRKCVNGVCQCDDGWYGTDCLDKCYSIGENPFEDNCSKLNGCCEGLKLCFDNTKNSFTCQKTCDNDIKPDCMIKNKDKLKNCCSIPGICPINTGSCKNLTCCEICGNPQKCPNTDCKPCEQDRCYNGNECRCCAAGGDEITKHICKDGSKPGICCSGDNPEDGVCPINKKKCENGVSMYDACICNMGYEGDLCDKKSKQKDIVHCDNYDSNSIFISHGRGSHGCYGGKGPNLQNIPDELSDGKISGGVYKCGVSDITLSGGSDKSCIYTSTIGTIDMSKVSQIDFDLFAEDCDKDWCSIWLDPFPYPKVADSGKSGEIDFIEIMSDQRDDKKQALRTNFGGAYGEYAKQQIWNDIYPLDMKNIKKHVTLRKRIIGGDVIAYINICDDQNECPDLESKYKEIAWINLSKFPVGDPNTPPGTLMKYNIVVDIWKTNKSPDGSYSGGSNTATDCKFTVRNLKIKYE